MQLMNHKNICSSIFTKHPRRSLRIVCLKVLKFYVDLKKVQLFSPFLIINFDLANLLQLRNMHINKQFQMFVWPGIKLHFKRKIFTNSCLFSLYFPIIFPKFRYMIEKICCAPNNRGCNTNERSCQSSGEQIDYH